MKLSTPVAVITGASSGIGAATAQELSASGYHVVLGARRLDKLNSIAQKCNGTAIFLDVTDQKSVDAFTATITEKFGRCDLLVNNAGGAIGNESISDALVKDWQWMFDTNVLGTLRVTKGLLQLLISSGNGLIVTVGSIAAREPYRGGGGYNVAKHGIAALTRVLRLELLGQPVRICEIDPGIIANTEFATIRSRGNQEEGESIYEGMEPLEAQDIAEAIAWVASRPTRVNIDQMLIMPLDQGAARDIHRV